MLFLGFIDSLLNLELSGGVTKIINLAIIVIILFVVGYFGRTVITKIIRNAIISDRYASPQAEKQREDTLISILGAILKIALWVFGSMLILVQLGVNIGPLIAGASIAGIAIGFGAQAIVKDFVSGLFIILENQYRLGDSVVLADTTGTVEAITIRQTVLRDYQGSKHYVPNGQIGVVTNMSMDYSNLVLDFDVAYETQIEKVRKIIDEVGQKLSQESQFKDKFLTPAKFLRIQAFEGEGVVLRIIAKVKPGSQWQLAGELRLRLKTALDKNKIEQPHQQITILQKSEF